MQQATNPYLLELFIYDQLLPPRGSHDPRPKTSSASARQLDRSFRDTPSATLWPGWPNPRVSRRTARRIASKQWVSSTGTGRERRNPQMASVLIHNLRVHGPRDGIEPHRCRYCRCSWRARCRHRTAAPPTGTTDIEKSSILHYSKTALLESLFLRHFKELLSPCFNCGIHI